MEEDGSIISFTDWLKTPFGRHLLAWEQAQLDATVCDLFGFHALQMGLPELDGLRTNRMPHRWLASDGSAALPAAEASVPATSAVSLHCDFDALPFDSQSLDLVVLPHALELARDPHLALSEVERVLVPEGRVVIAGFNPISLLGLGHRTAPLQNHRIGQRAVSCMPISGEFIGHRRLRDWLRLLSFEVETGRFGCYAPPFSSEKWFRRLQWMDAAGARWWPVFGSVYLFVAVKRVRGMRLVGLARRQSMQRTAAPAVAVNHNQDRR